MAEEPKPTPAEVAEEILLKEGVPPGELHTETMGYYASRAAAFEEARIAAEKLTDKKCRSPGCRNFVPEDFGHRCRYCYSAIMYRKKAATLAFKMDRVFQAIKSLWFGELTGGEDYEALSNEMDGSLFWTFPAPGDDDENVQ